MTIFEARKTGSSQISEHLKTSQTPNLDCDVILQNILGCSRTYLLMHREEVLSEKAEKDFFEALEKRKTGLPVAYITGHKEFYGYDYSVTPDVLIPKPDTEILVELAVKKSEEFSRNGKPFNIIDMCTGSGCIGITVAAELEKYFQEKNLDFSNFPDFILADISPAALKIAGKNAEKILSSRVKEKFSFVETNLFENIGGVTGNSPLEGVAENAEGGRSEGKTFPTEFSLILTNPPYVPKIETDELLSDGRGEPRLALNGDVLSDGRDSETRDGLELIRNLVPQCRRFLASGGWLFMETGEYNAEEAEKLLENQGFIGCGIQKDLSGQLRVVYGKVD